VVKHHNHNYYKCKVVTLNLTPHSSYNSWCTTNKHPEPKGNPDSYRYWRI